MADDAAGPPARLEAALAPSAFAAQPHVGQEASPVKPALKQLSFAGGALGLATGQPPARAVSWMDADHGQQLTSVREFEPSELDTEQSFDERGWCCCLQ